MQDNLPRGSIREEDFIASVVEPLIVAATRYGFQIILAHEDSQDHPFWWDRDSAWENRIHLQKDPFQTSSREISNGCGECVAYLYLSHDPINVIPFLETNSDEDEADYCNE